MSDDQQRCRCVKHLAMRCCDVAAHEDEGNGIQRQPNVSLAGGIKDVCSRCQSCEQRRHLESTLAFHAAHHARAFYWLITCKQINR